MNRKHWFGIMSVLFGITLIFLNNELIQSWKNYSEKKIALANSLNYEQRFFDQKEWLNITENNQSTIDYSNMKLSFIRNYGSDIRIQQHQQELEQQLLQIKQEEQSQSQRSLYLLLSYILLALLLSWFWHDKKILLIGILSVSIICLDLGIATPVLEISAIEHNLNLGKIPLNIEVSGVELELRINKVFQGDTYFYYQIKSILGLIQLLFEQGSLLVGLCVLIFSIIFPLIKTLLMFSYSIHPDIALRPWFEKWVLNISKWSMSDVFVVAILLGFLSFQNMHTQIQIQSEVAGGLYYFLAYCILSIISSMLVHHETRKRQPVLLEKENSST